MTPESSKSARQEREIPGNYVHLVDQLQDQVYRFDIRSRKFVFANKPAMEFYGADESNFSELVTPKTIAAHIHPEDIGKVREEGRRSLEPGVLRGVVEYRFLHPDGSIRWVQDRWTVVRDDGGTPLYLDGVVRDNTLQRQTEEALRVSEQRLKESEETYRNLFNNAQVGLFRTRIEDGMVLEANNRMASMLGFENRRHLIGTRITPEHYVDRNALRHLLEALRRYNEVKGFEVELRKRDGSTLWARFSARRFPEKGWNEGVVEDITMQRHLEEQLEIRRRMDSFGILAGGIAHDFNNLLAAIMGYVDLTLQERERLSGPQAGYLKNALASCHRASDLLHELRYIYGVDESGKEAVDVFPTAGKVFDILRNASDNRIPIYMDIPPQTFFVKANPSELHRVLMNLGNNAVRALEEKGITAGDHIRLYARKVALTGTDLPGLAGGEYIHLVFEDTGVGMSEEVRNKAFDPLFSTHDRGIQKGQGLGLAIVYNIVTRNHKGYVTIESIPGKGASVHLYFPCADPDRGAAAEKTAGTKGETQTVLIVEDEEMLRAFLSNALSRLGYHTLTAADGLEGLKIYREQKDGVSLVLLDQTMPGMSGDKVLRRILEVEPKAKVIISSAHQPDQFPEGTFAGAVGFLPKPFRVKDLADAIRAALDR